MNNDRLSEDGDKAAIRALQKIGLLLESDPDVIESMSWDELQNEILEEGLDKKRPPSSEVFEAWSRTVIRRHCLNRLRHSEVVRKHAESVVQMNCAAKRNSIPIERSVVPTPEDELIEKEEKRKWAFLASEIHDKVRQVIAEDVIASRWSQGQALQEIACEVDQPLSTVYRKLHQIQRAVLKAIAIEVTEENRVLIREGLRELFANSLQPPL